MYYSEGVRLQAGKYGSQASSRKVKELSFKEESKRVRLQAGK